MYAVVLKFIMLHSKDSLDDCNIADVVLALEHCLCVCRGGGVSVYVTLSTLNFSLFLAVNLSLTKKFLPTQVHGICTRRTTQIRMSTQTVGKL